MAELTFTIPPEMDGRQIKRIIRGAMGLSHRQFSMLKAAGGLMLDGRSVHANQVVRPGQEIRLTLVERAPNQVEAEEGPVNVVYADADLMVIDKCAPLATQSSPRQPGGSLENRLRHRCEGEYVFRPVNRLDKGTSGLMVVAVHAHAQQRLSAQLHTEDFAREYLAVVCGCPPLPEGVIDLPIGKADGATIRREVRPDGRSARTHYKVIAAGQRSLVRLRLETGRTHQIRVHLSHLGCPVYGDFLYGQESALLPRRFALHSCHLSFLHPATGERLRFESPLPPELQSLLEGGDHHGA